MYWHTRCRHTHTGCPIPRPLLTIILDHASSRGRSSPSLSLSSSLEFGTIRQDPHRTGAAWPIYRASSVTSPPPLGGQGRHPPTAVDWHLPQTAARLLSLVLVLITASGHPWRATSSFVLTSSSNFWLPLVRSINLILAVILVFSLSPFSVWWVLVCASFRIILFSNPLILSCWDNWIWIFPCVCYFWFVWKCRWSCVTNCFTAWLTSSLYLFSSSFHRHAGTNPFLAHCRSDRFCLCDQSVGHQGCWHPSTYFWLRV